MRDGPPGAPGAAGARPDHDADLFDDGAVPAAAIARSAATAAAAAFALPGPTGTQFNRHGVLILVLTCSAIVPRI